MSSLKKENSLTDHRETLDALVFTKELNRLSAEKEALEEEYLTIQNHPNMSIYMGLEQKLTSVTDDVNDLHIKVKEGVKKGSEIDPKTLERLILQFRGAQHTAKEYQIKLSDLYNNNTVVQENLKQMEILEEKIRDLDEEMDRIMNTNQLNFNPKTPKTLTSSKN